uniref:Uncharacterized protein n=1 Tax=Kalanchoe fedtschenkoi TaxID=63787 RepID=A0A7N0SY99_KALFE
MALLLRNEMFQMFLEIFASIGPFVSICIRIPIHGSLGSINRNKRVELFLLTLFQIR